MYEELPKVRQSAIMYLTATIDQLYQTVQDEEEMRHLVRGFLQVLGYIRPRVMTPSGQFAIDVIHQGRPYTLYIYYHKYFNNWVWELFIEKEPSKRFRPLFEVI